MGFADEDLREDFDVVRTAVAQKGGALTFASAELQASRELQLLALQTNGFVLHSLKNRKQDISVMVAALERKGTIGKQSRLSLESSILSVFPSYTSSLQWEPGTVLPSVMSAGELGSLRQNSLELSVG